MLSQADLRMRFESEEAKTFLRDNGKKTKKEPFVYHWVSNDNPLEDLAITVIFPNFDVAWIGLLVIGNIQYIPQDPNL